MAPPKPSQKPAQTQLEAAVNSLWTAYNADTSPRLKLIDAFLVFIMFSGIAQFVYCVLVTSFPFNAFLAGYVLLFASLRCVCVLWEWEC